MADQVQWGPLVQKLLRKKGNEGLELPKLVKKAVKAAHAQHQDLGKKALQRALESFLDRGHGFIVQDGRVLQPSNQQGKPKGGDALTSPALSDGLAAAAEALAELGSQPGPSSPKKHKAAAKAQREEQQEQQPAGGKSPTKKQGAKQQQQEQQEQQQPAAGKAASKKRGAQEQREEHAADGSAQPEAEQRAAGAKSKKQRRQAAGSGEQQQQQPEPQQEPAQQQEQQQHGSKAGKKRKQAEASAQQADGAAAAEQSAPQRGAAGAGAAAAAGATEQQQDGEEERPRQKRQRAKKGQAAAAAAEQSTPQQNGAAAAAATPSTGAAPILGSEADVKRWRESNKRSDVKSGPFSEAEKETIRQAVILFAEQNGHSTEDFDWLFDRTKKRAKRGESVWGIIAEALPNRTYKAVWTAGMRMFHPGNYQGRFTAADDTRLRQLVAEHGTKWKVIGPAMGRMPASCKDRWKEIKLGSERCTGPWSEEETQKLDDAVKEYLELKKAHQSPGAAAAAAAGGDVTVPNPTAAAAAAATGGGSGSGAELPLFGPEGGAGAGGTPGGGGSGVNIRRHVLDDIDWGIISAKVGTRSDVQCLEKWYDQLCPSMVDRGEWGPGDDRRLLRAIFESGAAQDFELDWGELVPQRTTTQTRRRWRLMLKCVPNVRNMDFPEVVDFLVGQYMPQLKQQGQEQGQQQQQQQHPEGGEGATPGQ